MRVVHYGGKEGKKTPNGQWQLKALCIQVVHPDVVLHPLEEGTSFPNMHKGIIWASSSPAKKQVLIVEKFKITSGSNEEENKDHLNFHQPT